MLTTLLHAGATLLLVNVFLPFLTLALWGGLLWRFRDKLPESRPAKFAVSGVALLLLHVLMVVGGFFFMLLASKYTGVIYWAA